MKKTTERKDIKNYIKRLKKGIEKVEEEKFTLYNSNKFAIIANRFTEPLTVYLLNKFPDLFRPLLKSLKLVRFNMLSKSYISLMLFLTFLSLIVFSVFFSVIFLNPITGIALGFVLMIFTFIIIYFYPQSDISTRRKRIKNELPFAIIHMAAVSGSGTPPINIFSLLVKSEQDYPELSKEFKKILNYINIFGYNLSTALKGVADTTPSPEFKELLNGVISSIETGGNLQQYLDNKAKDSLSTYQLERKKYVESIATYSDIYTALLVAAPLLFITTLTIINVIGGAIGGLSVSTIATVGTFVVLPGLNLVFIIFLNLTKQE
ncbi:MAG: type II secretion system F family protein [Nanoarchaeota archaeon]|nr:type II secretion system F family protein [Nanoarchaeota archaeon]MBU0962343.1 type II secretion system F family protein [Nanoarchaeota archaeon]